MCGLAMLDNSNEVEVGYGIARAHWAKDRFRGTRASLPTVLKFSILSASSPSQFLKTQLRGA